MEFNLKDILSEQQCQSIVRAKLKTDKFHIINYEIKPISEIRKGCLGEYFYLNFNVQLIEECNNKPNQTCHFFIKQKSEDDEENILIDTGENMTKIYDKEATLYQIISSNDNDTEHPWIAQFYGYYNKKLLIFDNLAAKGFKQVEKTQFDLQHCKQVMKTLAKLHACSLNWSQQQQHQVENFEFLTEVFYTRNSLNGRSFFSAAIKSLEYLIELLANPQLPHVELKRRLNVKIDKILEQAQPSKTFPNVLTHGDLWANNMLFQYDEQGHVINCCLVDFQLVKFTPPVFDVLFFLYQVPTPEFQQQYFHLLIDFYYEHLTENLHKYNLNLDQIFTKMDFMLAIQEYTNSLKLITYAYSILSCLDQENLVKILTTTEHRIEVLIGDRIPYLKQSMANNVESKNKLLQLSRQIEQILVEDRIFRENCYEILALKLKTTNYTLTQFALHALPTKIGYLGEHQILRVQIEIDNTTKNYEFFCKFLPGEPEQRKTLLEWQGFEREVLYYGVIFEKMKQFNINIIPDVVPEMYLAIKNYILVLDDLTQNNYRMRNKYKQLDLSHVQCFLKTLAKFHAASIILEERMTQSNLKPFHICDIAPNIFTEPSYRTEAAIYDGFKGILYVHQNFLSEFKVENFPEKLNKLKSKFMTSLKRSNKYINVLCHGDLWSNNVMFQYNDKNEPINCRIVDFQLGRYLPQAHDVIAAMYLMTNTDLFETYYESLLEEYYLNFSNILTNYGINSDRIISYTNFLESCEEMKVFGLLQKATYYQFIMMTPTFEKEFCTNMEKQKRIVAGDLSEMIEENWRESEVYRELIRDSHIPVFKYCQNLTL